MMGASTIQSVQGRQTHLKLANHLNLNGEGGLSLEPL